MSLRSFEQEESIASVAIQRPVLTKEDGTFESDLTHAAVTGMSALCVALGGVPAWAQEGERILQVDVRGSQTVAKETILARVQTRPGMLYQDAVVSEDIRRLFALGYFTDLVQNQMEPFPDPR